MASVLKSFWALSCLSTFKMQLLRSFSTALLMEHGARGRGFLGQEERGPISVDPVRLLACMAEARCVCVPICFMSGNPGYLENSGRQNNNKRSNEEREYQRGTYWLWHCCQRSQSFPISMFPKSMLTCEGCLMI